VVEISLAKFAQLVGGTPHQLDSGKIVSLTAVIDSRDAKPGTFFVAFKGEHLDGHDFADLAFKAGAEFSIVSRPVASPHILVKDVRDALTKIAKFNREALPNLVVIGITGSQGKTTTKDLAAHLLRIMGNTVSPKASLNNELGVPLLLLQCGMDTKYCVVEMGARHKGDIKHLVDIASPNIGVVLNVGNAHLGEFGSRELIAETKAELITGLSKNGVAILGSYDEFTPRMSNGTGLKTVIFGESLDCDVRATDIEIREGRASFDLVMNSGRAAVSLQLLGMHQISNALAAASIANEIGMGIDSIAAALSTAESASKWRMELKVINDVSLINDSYNANPESMAAALKTLSLLAQERGGASWAILGKMHELGESQTSEHQAIGKIASESGLDHLISVGVTEYLGQGETLGEFVENQEEALKFVQYFSPGDVVLVKGSRAENLDLLAAKIEELLRNRLDVK
jgi:UDP-N-acetylmuramoyl-tripeptide--D-alanyl-D-alanine ligase